MKRYSIQLFKAYSEGDRAQETDEEPVEVIPIRQQEAMQAVQLLQRYRNSSMTVQRFTLIGPIGDLCTRQNLGRKAADPDY
jgi:hypothetical protein